MADRFDLVSPWVPMPDKALIPKHGGYRKLKSFQVAQLVYDVTVRFCDRYVEKRSRTHDQMIGVPSARGFLVSRVMGW